MRLKTLGGLVLVGEDGSPHALSRQRKRLALLVLLAMAGERGVSRDKLLTYLWPESDSDQGRNSLNQLIYGLRREVGGDAVIGASELRLDPALIASDVADYRQALAEGKLAEAVDGYSGPFLDGFFLKGLPEFERWVDEERARLATSYDKALERLVAEAERAGDSPKIVDWWHRRAVAQPLSARIARGFATALAGAGDRAAATRSLLAHVALVRSELEIEPDESVQSLLTELRGTVANGGTSVGVARPGEDLPIVPVTPEQPTTDLARPSDVQRVRVRSQRWSVLAVLLLLVAVAVASLRNGPDLYEPNSVIVVPFADETAASQRLDLAFVVADWVSGGLTTTGLLDVIDARSAAGFLRDSAGRIQPALAAAQRAGAGTMVHGQIYLSGDSLRARANIVRVSDGSILASLDPVSAPASDPNQLLEPLREAITGAFAVLSDERLAKWVGTRSAPPTYASYQFYVRGLDALTRRHPDSAALQMLEAARSDTMFAQARLMLLELADLPKVSRLPSVMALVDTLRLALPSIRARLTPYDQAALDATVATRQHDRLARVEATRRMVSIAPLSAVAHYNYGHALIAINDYGAALEQLHAVNLDRSWLGQFEYLWVWEFKAHHLNGDYAGALRESDRVRRRFPRSFELCLFASDQYAALGDTAAMRASITQCLSMATSVDTTSVMVTAANELEAHGHATKARPIYEEALERRLARNPQAPALVIRAALGRWTELYALHRVTDTTLVSSQGEHGIIAARAGDRATATRISAWLADSSRDRRDRQVDRWRAAVALALGDRDAAVKHLTEFVRKGNAPAFNLHAQWYLTDLVGYPPYEALVRSRSLR